MKKLGPEPPGPIKQRLLKRKQSPLATSSKRREKALPEYERPESDQMDSVPSFFFVRISRCVPKSICPLWMVPSNLSREGDNDNMYEATTTARGIEKILDFGKGAGCNDVPGHFSAVLEIHQWQQTSIWRSSLFPKEI